METARKFGELISMTAPKPESDTGANKWIWPFELLEQIGEGGMGLVYRARYIVNDREVALKMLPRDVTDETTLARFERELEVLKNLKHPNIVRCFGGSCENSRRFYAMELIEGGSLEDKLQEKKRLPWEQVIFYGLQMCDALECSHEKGVVHRDLKPSNFLITKSGRLKLSDFGLASVAAARKITAAGKTAGTFLYMAPEQIRGHEISPQTDLYALGCVLYELVTGVPPFLGSTPAATLHMHCKDTPPRPTEKALDCPLALEKIILQLLEKDAKDRPQSAAEVGKRLRAVKRAVTVVSTEADGSLERSLAGQQAAETEGSAFFKLNVAPKAKSVPMIPSWVIAALYITLLCSLSWNLINAIRVDTSNPSEALWIDASSRGRIEVRLEAIRALGQISRKTGREFDILVSSLDDDNEMIREASASALGISGAQAKKHIPTLIGMFKNDPSAAVRTAAQKASETLKSSRNERHFPWAGTLIACVLISATGAGIYFWIRSPELSIKAD